MKRKLFLLLTSILVVFVACFTMLKKPNIVEFDENSEGNKNFDKLISVLVDGVEQSAFPSKGSAELSNVACTNSEGYFWDEDNWKLSITDISASTRCVVHFTTGGHSVFVSISGGVFGLLHPEISGNEERDTSPKTASHNGNVTFKVESSNTNYVFSSAKCTNVQSSAWANGILSVNGVMADAYCEVVFARPTYTVYFDVVGGYTEDNYLTVVRGGGNSTTYGNIAGYLTSGSTISCTPGITGKLAGTRVVISNVIASGDCKITCARDTSNYLPAGGIYNRGDEVSYANLAWSVISSDEETVTMILKGNAIYSSTSSSNPTGTGIFGSGVTYTSSSARSYIVDIWLEQDSQKYLRNAIDTGGLKYQDDANGYIRLPYASEISRDLPNASNTNFWTMDDDGNNHMYYGQPDGYLREGYNATDGKYYYEFYTLATNNSVKYTWTGTTSEYYSTTCFARNQESGTASTSDGCDDHKDDYATYCNASSGPTSVKMCSSYSGKYWYVSCAGQVTISSYSPATYCSNTCKKQSFTATVTLNPYSGNSYNGGQYGAGYKKWTKNVAGSEVTNTTATKNTTLSYNNTTAGNSGMTTGVQAVSPNESEARINDSVPTTSAQTLTGTFSTPYYNGYSASASIDSTCNSLKMTTTPAAYSKQYTRYTLQAHNKSAMGYRPVIVVYKAN